MSGGDVGVVVEIRDCPGDLEFSVPGEHQAWTDPSGYHSELNVQPSGSLMRKVMEIWR